MIVVSYLNFGENNAIPNKFLIIRVVTSVGSCHGYMERRGSKW